MKKSLLLVIMSVAVMLTLCFAVCAAPAVAPSLMSESGMLSGEIDLNVSELFIVERGYAVPVAEKDLPAEYLMYDKVETELWHTNLYLVEKDELVFAPVLACDGGQELIVNGELSDAYNKQYCKYTLYTSGIYMLEPVTTNADATVLDGSDGEALYCVNGDKNVEFAALETADTYSLVNAVLDKNVTVDENTLVLAWEYNDAEATYELFIYDKSTFVNFAKAEYSYNYVVKNNPDENGAEILVYAIGYDVQPNIKTVIISLSVPGVDEDGKYRNYYDVFNPYTCIKEQGIVGSFAANSHSELPAALETGLVVTVKNGVINEKAAPLGKIDTSDSAGGLVWIDDYDAENNTFSVVPVYVTEDVCCKKGFDEALDSYSFDGAKADANFDGKAFVANADGKVNYKLTDNTVVSVLKHSIAGENTTKWGVMSIGEASDIAKGNKNYKCYYDKALDSDGNYTTKYAPNIAAYVYGTDSSDGIIEAEFVLVIVNELGENQKGMFNKAQQCQTHFDDYTIENIRVYVAPNDDLAEVPADTVNIEMKVKNNKHIGSATLMLCTYDQYGVLLNVFIKTSTASAGETDTLTAENIANADGKIASVKAFVFDTTKLLSPLAKAIEK